MIKLTIYGTSSKGNCFKLSSDTTNILIDVGVKKDIVLENINKIDGILITHKHKDHCGYVPELKKYYNKKYYSNVETIDYLGIMPYQKQVLEPLKKFSIKSFIIMPFEVYHDVRNFGYLIKDEISNKKILHITDTSNIDNLHFKGISYINIECNFSRKYVESLEEQDYKYKRTNSEVGHLSLEDCISFLKNTIDEKTEVINLIHISSSNENYKAFEEEVIKAIDNKNIKVNAIDPHLKQKQEIILEE